MCAKSRVLLLAALPNCSAPDVVRAAGSWHPKANGSQPLTVKISSAPCQKIQGVSEQAVRDGEHFTLGMCLHRYAMYMGSKWANIFTPGVVTIGSRGLAAAYIVIWNNATSSEGSSM